MIHYSYAHPRSNGVSYGIRSIATERDIEFGSAFTELFQQRFSRAHQAIASADYQGDRREIGKRDRAFPSHRMASRNDEHKLLRHIRLTRDPSGPRTAGRDTDFRFSFDDHILYARDGIGTEIDLNFWMALSKLRNNRGKKHGTWPVCANNREKFTSFGANLS
jgi:hypothetical protein